MDRDLHLLLSIVEAAELIKVSTANHDLASFLTALDARDAVTYRVLGIGEMARRLSSALKDRHPKLPWGKIVALRNLLAHEYPVVDYAIIWSVVTDRLPELVAACRAELASYD